MTTRAMLGAVRPLTHPRHLPVPSRVWTAAEWDVIRHGHRSRSATDRWNSFAESGRLYLHRRGTGVGIYEAGFTPFAPDDGGTADGGWVIRELVLNGDPSVHRLDSPRLHALHFEALVDSLLLGVTESPAISALREAMSEAVPA